MRPVLHLSGYQTIGNMQTHCVKGSKKMTDDLQLAVLNSGDIVPLVAVGGGFAIIIISIIFRTIRHFVSTKAKEETKREICLCRGGVNQPRGRGADSQSGSALLGRHAMQPKRIDQMDGFARVWRS